MSIHYGHGTPDPYRKPQRRPGLDGSSAEQPEAERAHRRTRPRVKRAPRAAAKPLDQVVTERFEQLAKGKRREARRIAKEGQLTAAERSRLIHLQKLDRTGRRDEFTKEDRILFRRGVPLMETEDKAASESRQYDRLRKVLPADYVAKLEEDLQIDENGKYSRRLGGPQDD